MSTLLIRLAGPLQSWGINSNFDTRATERYPSKSGVIGLLAAAQGIRRDGDLSALCALGFGVRADKEGTILKDYHTVHGVKSSYVTYRYYLADAVFLAGVESEDEAFLLQLDDALKHPVFPLFLGRRSCPPALPLSLGIREGVGVWDALKREPWIAPQWYQKRMERRGEAQTLRVITDAAANERGSVSVRDVPESFSPYHRKYGYRGAIERKGVLMAPEAILPEAISTEHDPFLELEGGHVPEQTGT